MAASMLKAPPTADGVAADSYPNVAADSYPMVMASRPRPWPVARRYSGVTADAKWVELTREWRRLCAPKESAREVLLTRLCARPLQDAQLPHGNRPYLVDTTGPRLWRLRAATSRAPGRPDAVPHASHPASGWHHPGARTVTRIMMANKAGRRRCRRRSSPSWQRPSPSTTAAWRPHRAPRGSAARTWRIGVLSG